MTGLTHSQSLFSIYMGLDAPHPKHPRALMEQLGNVETKIATRIACNDFTSTAGTDTFWRQYCFVVSLVKPTGENNLAGADAKS
ncbi:hypothetical protein BC827DRAFT_1196190, partial [Russula dissimulans]